MHRRGDRRRQEGRYFLGTLGEAVAEPIGVAVLWRERESPGGTQRVQVTYRQLENVRFLQLRYVLTLGLQRGHHQVLQLVQTAVDAGAPLSLQHRLHHLAVLISARHRLFVLHAADWRVASVRRHDHSHVVSFISLVTKQEITESPREENDLDLDRPRQASGRSRPAPKRMSPWRSFDVHEVERERQRERERERERGRERRVRRCLSRRLLESALTAGVSECRECV